LIICKTIIGFGSPNKSGSHDCHGAPLGDEEIALTRKALGWEYGPFEIPAEYYAEWSAKEKGAAAEKSWEEKFAAYAKAYPELAAEFTRRVNGELQANPASIASRKASQNAIEAYAHVLPEFLGGSADLASSNLTLWSGSKPIRAHENVGGNYLNYGVREFGMSAIMNGIALHGGLLNVLRIRTQCGAYGGINETTFFIRLYS